MTELDKLGLADDMQTSMKLLAQLTWDEPEQVILFFESEEDLYPVVDKCNPAALLTLGSFFGMATLLVSLPAELRELVKKERDKNVKKAEQEEQQTISSEG